MNPGIVLTSLTRKPRPGSSKKKSTRAIASQRDTRRTRATRERAHLGDLRVVERRGARAAPRRRPRTCPRTCRTRRPGTTSPGQRRLGRVVAEHRDLDLATLRSPPRRGSTRRTRARGRSRPSSSAAVVRLAHPDRRSHVRRLHEARAVRARPRPGRRTRPGRRRRGGRGSAACGSPRGANTCFIITLSIPTAEPSTPDPTYGRSASSSRPWTVPSSPYGPCSSGNTTSTSSPPPPGRGRPRRRAARARDAFDVERGRQRGRIRRDQLAGRVGEQPATVAW